MNKMIIGNFHVISGELVVSDPCYSLESGFQGDIKNAERGTWEASIYTIHDGHGGIACLEAKCVTQPGDVLSLCAEEYKIAVDSAQAGIFDRKYYQDADVVPVGVAVGWGRRWLGACCEKTEKSPFAGVIPFGAVSESGNGDGFYQCICFTNEAGLVARVAVIFRDNENIMKTLLGQ